MANYVENIKVGSGETRPVRDAEARTSIDQLTINLGVAQETANTAVTNAANAQNTADTHIASKSNPHSITKAQVGLGKVNNNAIGMSLSGTTLTITFT